MFSGPPAKACALWVVLLLASRIAADEPPGRGLLLAGEPVVFDASLRPLFTERQSRQCAPSIREGLAKWTVTEQGQSILGHLLGGDVEISVSESADEPGPGRAPQPGMATILAAGNPRKLKRYELILNPALAAQYGHEHAIALGEPTTAAEVMAGAWAAEMLHIDFYARGIPLPHHERGDFQERWRAVAEQLGLPRWRHETEDP